MKWILENMQKTLGEITISIGGKNGIGAGIGAVFALINCFFGYRMMRFWIGTVGFFVGIWGGYTGSQYFLDNQALCAVIGIGAGVLMTFVAFRIYLAGVFLICGLFGFILFSNIGNLWFSEYETIVIIISALMGIGIGVAGVILSRPAIILTTAISGGMMASQIIFGIFGIEHAAAMTIVGVILSVLGIFWQFYNTRG